MVVITKQVVATELQVMGEIKPMLDSESILVEEPPPTWHLQASPLELAWPNKRVRLS